MVFCIPGLQFLSFLTIILTLDGKTASGLWRGPSSTQRQVRELISGPDLATRAQLLSFNRTQSRVVIGLLTGHDTLRRHI